MCDTLFKCHVPDLIAVAHAVDVDVVVVRVLVVTFTVAFSSTAPGHVDGVVGLVICGALCALSSRTLKGNLSRTRSTHPH